MRVLALALLVACSPSSRSPAGDPCTGGMSCMGADLQECVGGAYTTSQTCPSECNPDLGCVLCQPGAAICLGNTSHVCAGDGNGFTDTDCNQPGQDCNADTGACEAPCSP